MIWGGYHGALLILDRALGPWSARMPGAVKRSATFLLGVIGWVIFRSTSLTMAGTWLTAMAGLGPGRETLPRALISWALVGLLAVNTLPETWDIRFGVTRRWALLYAIGFFIAYLFLNETTTVFPYYRF